MKSHQKNALKEVKIHFVSLIYDIHVRSITKKRLQLPSLSSKSAIFVPIEEKSIASDSLSSTCHVFTWIRGEGGGEKRVTKLICKLARFSLRVKKKKKKE